MQDMLKVRVIPTLLYKSVGLVKGVGFDSWRRVDTVLPAIKVYNMREVDELILVDIEATNEERELDYVSIQEFSRECFVPFCVGGGVKNSEQIKRLLRAGADKVTINSAAYDNIELITEGASLFGSQCMVASIDCRKMEDGYHCFSHSGTIDTGYKVEEWARMAVEAGAGEILLTSIERDGTMQGYDIELVKMVTRIVNVPVIASGGAGNYEHMYEAVSLGGASAVAAASIFHFTEQTPKEAKMYLEEKGIPVRLR